MSLKFCSAIVFKLFRKFEKAVDRVTGRVGPIFVGLATVLILGCALTFFEVNRLPLNPRCYSADIKFIHSHSLVLAFDGGWNQVVFPYQFWNEESSWITKIGGVIWCNWLVMMFCFHVRCCLPSIFYIVFPPRSGSASQASWNHGRADVMDRNSISWQYQLDLVSLPPPFLHVERSPISSLNRYVSVL